MKRVYNTGLDTNKITMEVAVGTIGFAYSAIYLTRTGGQCSKINESNIQSGSVPNFMIGETSYVRTSYIVVRTLIDLSHLKEEERKSEIRNIIIHYKFSGGFSGNQVYNYDLDDITITPDGKFISITKPIEMI